MSRPVAARAELPPSSLLAGLRRDGCHVDCFATTVARPTTLERFVAAFYTTRLFKAERLLLALARGERDQFAAWKVVGRRDREILLNAGATSSWLAVEAPAGDGAGARLFFGSAIRPRRLSPQGEPEFDRLFHALLGTHEFYSRQLLQAAAARLAVQA